VHWKVAPAPRPRPLSGVVPVALAIEHLPADLDPAYLAAVLDGAVRGRATTSRQLLHRFHGSVRLTRAVSRIDVSAESGTESIARERMRVAGIEARTQVWFGTHRVDFLIAGRIVVEVDGRRFHEKEDAFEKDRRKAADLTRLGLHVLHFSYAQVLYDWPTCLAAIRVALAGVG
jgi:very-short-patch-repair endonuclease